MKKGEECWHKKGGDKREGKKQREVICQLVKSYKNMHEERKSKRGKDIFLRYMLL